MGKFLVLLLASAICGLKLKAQGKGQVNPPNIIFILTDDLGYGDLSIYLDELGKHSGRKVGGPFISTPNLDKMARSGAYMTDHYAAAPVCAPSRASVLTGKSQGHASVRNNQFDKALAEDYTFATLLKHGGYQTAAIGKWGLQGKLDTINNKNRWPSHPLDRGFDYFLGYMQHVDGHEHYPKEGKYRGRKTVWENNTDITEGLDKCYTADLWTAAAKKWIVAQKNKPFCLFLAYDTPHAVLELPTSAYPEGGGAKGGLQWLGTKGQMINTAQGTIDSWVHPDFSTETYDNDQNAATATVPWPETYKRYATSVRRIDDGVGDILQLLKDLNIDQNTLIVFTSDNGASKESYLPKNYVDYSPEFFQSYGPFDGIKRDVLEGGLRVPLIAYWPQQIRKGTVIQRPSISYDWLPTFVEAAGLTIPAAVDGVSLIPTLTGKGKQQPSKIYVEYQVAGETPDYTDFYKKNRGRTRGQMQMMRVDDTVAIRYQIKSADDAFEIYKISEDPGQTRNLNRQSDSVALQSRFKALAVQRRRSDNEAKRPYDDVIIPAVGIVGNARGMKMEVMPLTEPWLTKGNETGTAVLNTFDRKFPSGNRQISLSGYLNVPATGKYRFLIKTKGRLTCRVYDICVVDKDLKNLNGEKTFTLNLEKGTHPIRIESEIVDSRIPFSIFMENVNTGMAELSAMDFLYK